MAELNKHRELKKLCENLSVKLSLKRDEQGCWKFGTINGPNKWKLLVNLEFHKVFNAVTERKQRQRFEEIRTVAILLLFLFFFNQKSQLFSMG